MLRTKTSVIALFLLIAAMFSCFAVTSLGQPVLILRDFSVSSSPIERIDEDGIFLQDQTLIAWDQVSQITFDPADQARIDQLMENLGRPLFQIRWRLEIGDFAGAKQATQTIRDAILPRRGPGTLLIHLADMADQIEQGRVPNAALHWIQALELLEENPTWRESLPQKLEIPTDPSSQLHPQIFPTWSSAQAKEAWPQAEELLAKQPFERLPLAAQIYLIAISIDAQELDTIQCLLKDLEQKSPSWTQAFEKRLLAQSSPNDSAQLLMSIDASDWPSEIKAVTTYWIASELLTSSDVATSERAAVDMLSIPARYQHQFPELAAAALAAVGQRQKEMGDEVSAEKLYNEIERNYGQTNVARRLTQLKKLINEQTNAKPPAPGD